MDYNQNDISQKPEMWKNVQCLNITNSILTNSSVKLKQCLYLQHNKFDMMEFAFLK